MEYHKKCLECNTFLNYHQHNNSSPNTSHASKMHLVQPTGNVNLVTGIRIEHLVLKHRQGKNHNMRILLFIGSPSEEDEGKVINLADLKKEEVNCAIVSFGDHQKNNDLLTAFINALNGKDGTGSHLVGVPRGKLLLMKILN